MRIDVDMQLAIHFNSSKNGLHQFDTFIAILICTLFTFSSSRRLVSYCIGIHFSENLPLNMVYYAQRIYTVVKATTPPIELIIKFGIQTYHLACFSQD